MTTQTGDALSGCPIQNGGGRPLLGRTNKDCWPEALPVDILHQGGFRLIRCLRISTMPPHSRRSATMR